MNTISKSIIAAAIAVNLMGFALVCGAILHTDTPQATGTIQLGTIVVTPADADSGPVDLGTIVVTPSDADWRYAQAYGVQRPARHTIVLGTIVVRPTIEQMAQFGEERVVGDPSTVTPDLTADQSGVSLIEALEAFSPGHYLDTDAPLRLLNVLVFEQTGG